MEVVKLRTEVGQIKVDASALSDPAILAEYQKAQAQLGQSLSRLLAISESYPDLKASPLYQDLMTQLEGAENRITVARVVILKPFVNTIHKSESFLAT